MSGFEPAYPPGLRDAASVHLLVCVRCGAVVMDATRDRHRQWHASLDHDRRDEPGRRVR